MTTTSLTAVQTPSGNMTYKQANLIIELDLFEVTVFVRYGIGNDLGTDLCLLRSFWCLLHWTKNK